MRTKRNTLDNSTLLPTLRCIYVSVKLAPMGFEYQEGRDGWEQRAGSRQIQAFQMKSRKDRKQSQECSRHSPCTTYKILHLSRVQKPYHISWTVKQSISQGPGESTTVTRSFILFLQQNWKTRPCLLGLSLEGGPRVVRADWMGCTEEALSGHSSTRFTILPQRRSPLTAPTLLSNQETISTF